MALTRLTCKEASRLQSEAMDRQLTWTERISLRMHMAACEACTRVSRQLDFLRRALRDYPGPDDQST
jgi:hypothetical protein